MKKTLSLIVAVASIATISFFPTNTVTNSKNLAEEPPVVVYPPNKAPGAKSTPVIINIKTLTKGKPKLV